MNKSVIKILSIKIKNFKNIKNSEIKFYDKDGFINTMGIYGQNGSGKTAVVESLTLLQKLILEERLRKDLYYFINADSDNFKIEYNFEYKREKQVYYIRYQVKFIRDNTEKIALLNDEKIDIFDESNQLINKVSIKKENLKVKLDIFDMKHELTQDVALAAAQISNQLSKTMLFQNFVINSLSNDELIKHIIKAFKFYGETNLFVVGMKETSLISAIDSILLTLRMDTKNDLITSGFVLLNLFESTNISPKILEELDPALNQINNVMNKLIPNFKLGLKKVADDLDEEGKSIVKVQLVSIINDKEIPLKYESEGVKKLISLCSALIATYNNESVCLVVDELDSGIFEYLLGGLVKIIEQGAKGQLIFTSHNLRLLETLPKKCVTFTTNNEENRFVKMANVKPNNNLRDFYLRTILVGGQREELYSETDEFEIERALKKCKNNL